MKERQPRAKTPNKSYALTNQINNEIPKINQMLASAISCFDLAKADHMKEAVNRLYSITGTMPNRFKKVEAGSGDYGLALRDLEISLYLCETRTILAELIRETEQTTSRDPRPEEIHTFSAGVSCLQAAFVVIQPLANEGAKRILDSVGVDEPRKDRRKKPKEVPEQPLVDDDQPLIDEIPTHEVRD